MIEHNIYEDILNDINKSDMLLIGIGNELSAIPNDKIENMAFYKEQIDRIGPGSIEDFMHIAEYLYCKENTDIINLYNGLNSVIKEKNYFIFTTNYDAAIYHSQLNPKRIVAPCGNQFNFQCDCNGEDAIIEGKKIYEECIRQLNTDQSISSFEKIIPRCKICNKKMVPNVYKNQHYNESGYLKQWDLYNKWLQGSLNKNIIILELGEGFQIPNVMRWPFERIAFLNNKAKLYRVNKLFPQLDEKLGNKGVPLQISAMEFLKNLVKL
jgi:hypothetical protein